MLRLHGLTGEEIFDPRVVVVLVRQPLQVCQALQRLRVTVIVHAAGRFKLKQNNYAKSAQRLRGPNTDFHGQ